MTTDELTPREREVLALAERGLTNDAIALRLGISRNAVRYHLKELHSKLGTGGARTRLVGWRRLRSLLPALPGAAGAKLAVGTAMGAFAIAGSAAALTLSGPGAGPGAQPVLADGRYPNGCPDRINAWHNTTLEAFAAEYFGTLGTYDQLAELNPHLVGQPFPADTSVRVPYNPNAECGEAQPTPAGAGPAQPGGAPAPSASPSSAALQATPTPAGSTYIVGPDDTLAAIAAAHGITVASLLQANDLQSPSELEAGQVLIIPAWPR
jgi:DNA-binding CsgD family transcriptional regulator